MIFLSAGHFPASPGSCWRGFCEHDEAARWVALMASALGEHRAVSVAPGPIKEKIAFIRARCAPEDLAVEIHFGKPDNGSRGSMALYDPSSGDGRSKELAARCEAVVARFFAPSHGVMEGWYRGNPKFGAHLFLSRCPCVPAIVQPQHIHHREEIVRKRAGCSQALAEALLQMEVEDV
jgi:hypothetical protein